MLSLGGPTFKKSYKFSVLKICRERYLCHFSGQSFLNLESSWIDLNNSGKFAQAQDLLHGQVADADFSVKWDQMVLAEGEKFNVFYNH